MPKVTLELTPENVQDILFQLPPHDFLALADKVQERAETLQMMRLAETGFREWEHEEEDVAREGRKAGCGSSVGVRPASWHSGAAARCEG